MADIFERLVKNYGPIGQYRERAHGYFAFPKLEGEIGSRMKFRGKEVIVWSLNNYLGLANHPEVRKADADAAKEFGLAYPMGARMMSGNSNYHEQLERELADFVKKEDAALLNYGYQGMVSIIDVLCSRHDVVVYDAESHACIIDGVRLHAGHRYVYKHNDVADLEKQLQRATALVEKQKITPDKREEILELIHFTSNIEECVADIVIEAIVEKLDIKTDLFNKLAKLNSSDTIFATNTSSLSVSSIAKEIEQPERVAGLHFFNPAPLMKLVEVVKADFTSPEIITKLVEFTRKLGKEPVVCKDAPGFIVNRVARPYYIESLRIAEMGIVGFEVIDRLLESKGFKMGPFKLMDLIGNDVNYAVSCSVYDQLGQPQRLKPSYIQKEKVNKGELGKKTGKGYYDY